MRRRALWPSLLLLALVAQPGVPARTSDCARVFAVGDLHGAFGGFVLILQATGLIDEKLNWSGGDACLLQLGDIVDRGPESRKILDLLMRLGEQSSGHVETLVGNHEVMTVLGDLRYATSAEFEAFAAEETDEQRARGFEAFQGINTSFGLEGARLKEVFDATFPPGWFARREAFSPEGTYGSWLIARPMMVRIDDTLYVHGGPSPRDARAGIKKINRSLAREINEHIRLENELIEAGWLNELTPYDVSLQIVRDSLDNLPITGSGRAMAPVAEGYLTLAMNGTTGPSGPLWNRELARADEDAFDKSLREVLTALDVERIVVAHTTTDDRRIRSRFHDRVFIIDTGAGPAYGGQISALEISRHGLIRAYYPGGSEVLADPPMTDRRIEAFLREATIVHAEEIGTGITRPLKVRLELNGNERRAAFKSVDIHNPGMTRFEGKIELNFTDSYRYERAAYLLDRFLGMNMVPVAVLRPLEKKQGALIDWISNSMSEAERRDKNLLPEDPRLLIYQRAVMTIFDALISNSDRNLANQLITEDWKLHLIDHSRTFRLGKGLPRGFESIPLSMPRDLVPRLEAMDVRLLAELLDGLVSKAQIKAMLKRRDKLLAKLELDRKEFGDGLVFVGR